MKTILALVAVMLTTAVSAQAEWVRGHFRSNGTYVNSYYRTPANGTPYDNLSYRGYPSQQPGYVSPRSYGLGPNWSRPKVLPYYPTYDLDTTPRPYTGRSHLNYLSSSYSVYGSSTQIGGTTFHNYYSSDGGGLSGTTLTIGNTSFTSFASW